MALTCVNTDGFLLNYQTGGKRDVVDIAQSYLPNGDINYQTVVYGDIGEKLHYEITQDTLKNSYLAIGTFTDTGTAPLHAYEYYVHLWYAPEQRDSLQISNLGGEWVVYITLKDSVTSGDKTRFGTVRVIDSRSYQLALSETELIPQLGYNSLNFAPDLRVTPPGGGIHGSPSAASLNPPTIVRTGANHYNVRVYSDTRELGVFPASAWRNTPRTPEPDLVRITESNVIESHDQEFTKEFASQGVEVLQFPQSPHKKNVWLVELDEDGNEVDRNNIFAFELLPSQGVPIHKVTCLPPTLEECPDTTCSVSCGDTICCYNKHGVSIFNYPANP